MPPRRLASVVALFSLGLFLSVLLSACERGAVTPRPLPRDPGFYDYTTDAVTSLAELRQLAAVPPGEENGAAISGTKFVISSFSRAEARQLRFLDGRYYYFHDEWAWFRLLNGQPVPGMAALEPHPQKTPEDARRWALSAPDHLPEGLKLTDERLYAPEFYERSLAHEQRDFGAGSLIYVPARPPQYAALWAFELDYGDPAEVADVLVFFELLEAAIPKAVRGQLKWITRSPAQRQVAKQLVAAEPRVRNRVMSYEELSVPGETAVYTPGIVAGRLEVFRDLSRLAEAKPDSILLLGALPEYLPQARGLVSAVPQTPLAHLNLLAKSRQIVNAYRGGLLEDPEVQNLVRSGVPVVLAAEGGKLRFQRISDAQYSRWLNLKRVAVASQAVTEVSQAPYVVDLSQVQSAQLRQLAPLIGGKAVGMVHLLQAIPGSEKDKAPRTPTPALAFDVPDRPLAITVRAYREHLAPLLPSIRLLLADPNFQQHRKLRILALEGVKKFKERFRGARDIALADSYEAPRALGPIAAVVRQGGLQQMIRKTPLPEAVRLELERVLPQHFAAYSPEQGLRFRSSSTVEDIEGSSGAGLYDSATGYLVPRKAGAAGPKRPSIADALRKTWASYFSVEAFEERHSSKMDHLAADMAVLVHARFDDELELANGVFTFTQAPSGLELAVNAQPGAVSVTNPPTDRVVLPESSRVRLSGDTLLIERESLSSEARPGSNVLSDAELRELFALGQRLTAAQLALSNAGFPKAQQRRAFVLDFEFRRVKAGWPALSQGQHASRFIVKQMRPLEPSLRGEAQLREGPIPRDVLARARRIERQRCVARDLTLETLNVFTDPNALPDLGYSEQPLFAYVMVENAKGGATVFTHLDQRVARLNNTGFFIELNAGLAFSRLEVKNQILSATRSGTQPSNVPANCRVNVEYAEPREMLRSFLEAAPSP